ncbi:MAG: AAA family ATPase, partial [Dehalococcoidia bacterium]|nr:AAA family ATPase [Dehalococcoidia bacterium]
MISSGSSDPFVGRELEMAELTAALDSALESRGGLVMLAGEPGIGKTRIAEAITELAEDRGGEVLWGRCHEERGAPPYWPWVQIIRAWAVNRDAGALRSTMGSGAASIADIVAEIREVLPGLEPPPELGDPDTERFRLFDAVTSFLKRAASDTPLVLILDDLQWADESPLRLLEFISRELADASILIIGAYRTVDVSRTHPLFRTLGDLSRERLFSRVTLRGLQETQVGSLIA